MNLDYLVFSAHKTATQSMVSTLRENGYNAVSCHILGNHPVSMARGSFESYTHAYLLKHKQKIKIITAFREPIERHISSFFEWYGTKPLADDKKRKYTDTIIYKKTIPELQQQLISEISSKTLVGQVESIKRICNELKIELTDLKFDIEDGYGFYETETVKLYLFRFDILIQNISSHLEIVTKRKLRQFDANKSDTKWYRSIYSDFKKSLVIPRDTIAGVYASRQELIEKFYNEQKYEAMLKIALDKFG